MPDSNPYASPTALDEPVQTGPVRYATATHGLRFANFIIDYFAALVLPVVVLIAGAPAPSRGKLNLITYGGMFLYFLMMEGVTGGRTLGKFATGTKAVRQDGLPFSWGNAAVRSLCRFIPFDAFSALGEQPWHDSLSKTKVVRIRGKNAILPESVQGLSAHRPPAPLAAAGPPRLNRGSAPGADGRADGHASPEDRPPGT